MRPGLAAEIYARSLPEDHGDDGLLPDFEDRKVRVETTFAGAGVITGPDLAVCGRRYGA